MNWTLYNRQVLAVARLELKRHILARRWAGIYILAFAPVLVTLVGILSLRPSTSVAEIGNQYAAAYQFFILRFAIFFSCGTIFSQLFRGEILEKTLHFYMLAPVRRPIIALGKYLSGVIVSCVLFGFSTAATFLLVYYPSPSLRVFFLEGSGIPHLVAYVGTTILACVAYGAIFLVAGLLFRNPGPFIVILLAWESFNFVLTPFFQQFSVAYYLRSLLPVTVDWGPFAVLAEPASPALGIAGVLIVAAAMIAVAGWIFGRAQVTYSTD